jgi:alpha-1,6-mannosyltransferase
MTTKSAALRASGSSLLSALRASGSSLLSALRASGSSLLSALRASGSSLTRLRDLIASRDGRPAVLGCLGALLITAGSPGAGGTRIHDPVLDNLHLSWLRYGHGLVLSSTLLWTGVTLMLVAWIWLGRWVIAGRADTYQMVATTGFWLAPLLLSAPVFSRDIYSYLAQGALLRDGLDPYLVGPVYNPNSLLDDVSSIWATTTAPYGPAFLLLARFVTMLVGENVVAGTMVLRLCMLPGLALLIWAALRIARHIGANGAAALWICVLNPLVLIHLVGGVHNEMLMVGVMMAGIALTLGRHPVAGAAVVGLAVAVKATAGLALPFLLWVWMRQLQERHALRPATAFAAAAAGSAVVFVAVFAALSWIAGVGLGWVWALAGSVKIINWLVLPTALANIIGLIGGLFTEVDFYAVLEITRLIGVGTIAVALPLLWWRFRHNDREALIGIASSMVVVVLLVPAALPWYYSWPLAVISVLTQSQRWIAAIAGFSTWVLVIFSPDGSHGMYSWVHFAVASACAFLAWRALSRPTPEPDAPLPEPDESAARRQGGHS